MIRVLVVVAVLAAHLQTDAMPPSEPWWITAGPEAEAARLARCPGLRRGCFVGGATCQVSRCFCPRVCEPAMFTGRVWRQTAGACGC